MDFEILDIKVNKTDYNILAHAAKELVRKNLSPRLVELFTPLCNEIQAHEAAKVDKLKNEREQQNQEIKRLQN